MDGVNRRNLMIGLVLTTADDDPDYIRPVNLACRLTLDLLAERHPDHIRTLTDRSKPGVTAKALRDLVSECTFVFYWGHGSTSKVQGASLWGTNGTEIPLKELGSLVGKQLYLDGCSLAKFLGADNYPEARLIAPVKSVSYRASLDMGCGLMRALFGPRLTFKTAFEKARSVLSNPDTYALIGHAHPNRVDAPEEVRQSIVALFEDLQELGAL
jgi:hypothetical protein